MAGGFHERSWALFLQKRKIPYRTDLWIQTRGNYYPYQIDVCVEADPKSNRNIMVDNELDDGSHNTKKRHGKDISRDWNLMNTDVWAYTGPNIHVDLDKVKTNNYPWVIVRIPYAPIARLYRNDFTEKHSPKTDLMIKDMEELINYSINSTRPRRILWGDWESRQSRKRHQQKIKGREQY